MKLGRGRVALAVLYGLAFACGGSTGAPADTKASAPPSPTERRVKDGDPARGRSILASGLHGCAACHAIPGVASARGIVGPPLGGFARRVFIAGTLPNEPDTLVEFLQHPPALVPRTGMPDVRLRLDEARDVAAFLYTLDAVP